MDRLSAASWSLDHARLLQALVDTPRLLLIQDLDGVCMGLVRDPLIRRLDADYLSASRVLGDEFRVLTNGEHIGSRGVNSLVEAALGDEEQAAREGWYLPGLAAGGVQLQDRHGRVVHPGVSEAELAFLAELPALGARALDARLCEAPYRIADAERADLVRRCILDNAVSPTLNLNPLYEALQGDPERYFPLQEFAAGFLREQLERAAGQGLADAFFIHLAPNAGSDETGERLRPCSDSDAGTTDFQFMLSGAVKEVGVLVLLNHFLRQRTGEYPLGAEFNARQAPRDHEQLLELAARHFPRDELPRIVGIGDTVTSHRDEAGGRQQRGGSDRGFLMLVQDLGERFGTDNACVLVDSSAGEVRRPGVDIARLHGDAGIRWEALRGISDADDPLRINFLFPGGHREYSAFFAELARRRGAPATD